MQPTKEYSLHTLFMRNACEPCEILVITYDEQRRNKLKLENSASTEFTDMHRWYKDTTTTTHHSGYLGIR